MRSSAPNVQRRRNSVLDVRYGICSLCVRSYTVLYICYVYNDSICPYVSMVLLANAFDSFEMWCNRSKWSGKARV